MQGGNADNEDIGLWGETGSAHRANCLEGEIMFSQVWARTDNEILIENNEQKANIN